jgi:rubredoxin
MSERQVLPRQDEPTIADLIARKRAAGPDRGFENLLARPWVCPRCHFRGTILSALIDVAHPGSDMACPECKTPGFAPEDLS